MEITEKTTGLPDDIFEASKQKSIDVVTTKFDHSFSPSHYLTKKRNIRAYSGDAFIEIEEEIFVIIFYNLNCRYYAEINVLDVTLPLATVYRIKEEVKLCHSFFEKEFLTS